MKEALKFSGIEQNKNHEKIFKTKEDLVIFEIKNNINPIIIKRKLKELKQLEKELEDLKQQEEKLWISSEDNWKLQTRIKELKQWLKENTIKHIVKQWDTLYSICEQYYKNWEYSTILINVLWYKAIIIPGKILYLPSEKWMKKIKLGNIRENKHQNLNKEEKQKENQHKETNSVNIDNIDIQEINPDTLSIKQAEKAFNEWKISVIQDWLKIYAKYLETYANNLEFISITWRKKLQKNLVLASKSILDSIEDIKTQQDLINLYHKNIKYFYDNLVFDNKYLWNKKIVNQFKSIIKACINWIKTKLQVPQNSTEIKKDEVRKQVSNIRWEIFNIIRHIDETDDFLIRSWLYEANFYHEPLNHILTETDLLTSKELENIQKLKNLIKIDKNWNTKEKEKEKNMQLLIILEKLVNNKWKFIYNDSKTETQILQDNIEIFQLKQFFASLNLPENIQNKLTKESLEFFQEHFSDWYQKEIEKLAWKKYNELYLEQAKKIWNIYRTILEKYWYYQDIITGKIKEYSLLTFNKKPLKEVFEKIQQKISTLKKLPSFKTIYQTLLNLYKQETLSQYYLFLEEKLTNYYLEKHKDDLIKLWREDKLVDLYEKIHWIWVYKVSDKTETNLKFRWKEIIIQTLMLIPAIRLWNLPARILFADMKRTAWARLADYAISTFNFTQIYNVEDILRKENVDDKESFKEKYYKSLMDRKTLGKNFILLGWMKYLQEIWIVEKIEQTTIDQIGQKLWNKYNKLGEILWKLNGFTTEAITAISLMEWWTLIFDGKNITKEDILFAVAMVLSLKASWKIEKELTEFKLKSKIKALYILPDKADKQNLKKLEKEPKIKLATVNEFIEKLNSNKKLNTQLNLIVKEFAKKYQKRPWKEIKDKKDVKDKIDEFVNKALWIKWEKLTIEDKNIKNEVKKMIEKILEERYTKYVEEWGNNNYGGEIIDAKLSKAIKAEEEYELINKIIKSVNKQWVDILSLKAINWVEKFLNRYVWSNQFYKDYPKAEKLAKLDKTKQVKHLLNEYIQIWELVKELRNEKLSKTERLNKFIEWLEKIDKGMVELVKDRLEERGKAPKK